MLDNRESQSNHPGGYQVLARRTRPQTFAELVGQDAITTALSSMIQKGVIPHAFLFTGTRGTGKTSSARILAKSLCCINGPTATPCQTCIHCRQITDCAHDDILEIDGASNTGVDNVRDLRERAQFFPNSARYKVFIIDEVHMLSPGAFNALLKTLEEPPPQVVFVLATTELHKVPLTVRSRCITFSFRKFSHELLSQHLGAILKREGISFEEDAIAMIAREAKGSCRDSLSILEQVRALCGGTQISLEKTKEALSVLGQELADRLMRSITACDSTSALDLLRNADSASVDLATLLEDTATLFRHALVLRQCKSDDDARRITQLLPSEIQVIREHCQGLSLAAMSEVFRTLMSGAREVSRSTAALTWAEMTVLDVVSRSEWLSASELLGAFSGTPPSASTHVPASSPAPRLQSVPAPKSPSQLPPQPSIQQVPEANREPKNSADDSTGLALFEKVIAHISQTNVRLANKLKQASIARFDAKTLEFSSEEANKTLTNLTPGDASIFGEALIGCNLGDIEIRGMNTPIELLKLKNRKVSAQSQPTETLKVVAPAPTLAAAKPEPPRSLADRERSQKLENDSAREQRVLGSSHLKPLISLGTRAEVRPLEDEEDPSH